MTDTSRRKAAANVTLHPMPRQMISPAVTTKLSPPEKADGPTKGADGHAVEGYAVVAGVSQDNRAQVISLFRDCVMQASLQFGLDLLELGLPPPAHPLPKHDELSLPGLPAAMGETQEVGMSRASRRRAPGGSTSHGGRTRSVAFCRG
jgi:hypothetical protein